MKKRIFLSFAAMAALAVFTGCQSGGGPYLPKDATKRNYENTEPVVLMDRMVQRSVTASGVQQNRLPDGRLEVMTNLRNLETRRIQVQAQCEFKDAQGFPVDSTEWRNVILTENAQEGVRFTSMNDKAQRFTIRVRQAH
jgi:hypothetical protein